MLVDLLSRFFFIFWPRIYNHAPNTIFFQIFKFEAKENFLIEKVTRRKRQKVKFQTLILLNLILGPVCEALFYETIIQMRVERDFASVPYWLRKVVLIIFSPLLATFEEIWRAGIFFKELLSLRVVGRV